MPHLHWYTFTTRPVLRQAFPLKVTLCCLDFVWVQVYAMNLQTIMHTIIILYFNVAKYFETNVICQKVTSRGMLVENVHMWNTFCGPSAFVTSPEHVSLHNQSCSLKRHHKRCPLFFILVCVSITERIRRIKTEPL